MRRRKDTMSIFDKYNKENGQEFEELPIVKVAEIVNLPFTIEKIHIKTDMEGNFGKRDVAITTIKMIETDERKVVFAENRVLFSKFSYLKEEGGYKDVPLVIRYKNSANGNPYYDVEEI